MPSDSIPLPVLSSLAVSNRERSVPVLPEEIPDTNAKRLTYWLGTGAFHVPIRQSSFADLQTCKRMFLLRHRCGIHMKGYSAARERGTLAHRIMQRLNQGWTMANAVNDCRNLANSYVTEELERLDESGLLAQKADAIRTQIMQDFSLAVVMATVAQARMSLDPARYKCIAAELALSVRVGGLNHPLEMTIDNLLYDAEKHEVVIDDYKTTSKDPALYQATAAYSPQSRIYRVGATAYIQSGEARLQNTDWQIPADTPVTTMRYVAIKTPTIKQKKNQPWDDYIAEVQEWYTGTGRHEFTETGGSKALVDPYPHRFNEDLFTPEFEVQLREHDFYSGFYPYEYVFPRTADPATCRNHYGKPCVYLPICSDHQANWKGIVNQLYECPPLQEQPSLESVTV